MNRGDSGHPVVEEVVDQIEQLGLGGLDVRTQRQPLGLAGEGTVEPQEMAHHFELILALQNLDHVQNQIIHLIEDFVDREDLTLHGRLFDGFDQGVNLVKQCHRLVEQLTQEGSLLVLAVQPEDVVEPLGGFSVVGALTPEVLLHLVIQPIHVLVQRIR